MLRKGIAHAFTYQIVIIIYPTIVCLQALTFADYFLQACQFELTNSNTRYWVNVAVALLIICKSFLRSIIKRQM
jgi:hypothetical protein